MKEKNKNCKNRVSSISMKSCTITIHNSTIIIANNFFLRIGLYFRLDDKQRVHCIIVVEYFRVMRLQSPTPLGNSILMSHTKIIKLTSLILRYTYLYSDYIKIWSTITS